MEKVGRTNVERTREMRERLLAAARRLFVEAGYAATSTPGIVEAAAVTRGALYHHFPDKAALFRAVVEREAALVAARVEAADDEAAGPLERLRNGARVYLEAMTEAGRARLLLVEAAAVLGPEAWRAIDRGASERPLRAGLVEAMAVGALQSLPLEATTSLLSALFERAVLDVLAGTPQAEALVVVDALIAGLAPEGAPRRPRPRTEPAAAGAPDLFSFAATSG